MKYSKIHYKQIIFIVLFSVLLMGNMGCESPSSTVILPDGPQTAALVAKKDEQIKTLEKQKDEILNQRKAENELAAKAASSVKGILKANEYQPDGRPTEAIKEEASVALKRLPPDDPNETVKALERTIEMIEGKRDEALKMYSEAKNEAEKKKLEIVEKDKEIEKRDAAIAKAQKDIERLQTASSEEKEKNKKDLQAFLEKKDRELADFKKEIASRERLWWVNATRIAGLGLIILGAVAMALFKALPEGGGLIAGGVIIGVVSIFINWLTAQWWFPWACGLFLLMIVFLVGYVLYRTWKIKILHTKTVSALQDLRDESKTTGEDTWERVSEHLKYRVGDKKSFWGKQQVSEIASLGLINPDGEKAFDVEKQPQPSTIKEEGK